MYKILITILLILPVSISAQDFGNLRDSIEASRDNIRETREEIRENIEARRADRETQHEERRENIKVNINERRENREERREERKVRLEEDRRERVGNLLSNIYNVFTNADERIIRVDERLESKLDELAELGDDISDAELLLDEARDLHEVAKENASNIQEEIDSIIDSEFEPGYVRELIQETKESYKIVREAYREVVVEIKN